METPLIILVEDDDSIRNTMAELLESEGYRVRSFENGKCAVDGLKETKDSQLILLDWMMPVMNGEQFIFARKSYKNLCSVPIVVVSAVASQAHGWPGVADYMNKPIDIDNLLNVVDKYAPRRSKACS